MEARDHEYFMKKALSLAEEGFEKGEVPVGALLVCEGKIVARSHNQVELLHDATAHAEMLVITAACAHFQSKYLPDCTLYVTLEPCPMCASALFWTKLKAVVWGASDEKRGFTRFDPNLLHPATQIQSGILGDESSRLLKDFFQIRRQSG